MEEYKKTPEIKTINQKCQYCDFSVSTTYIVGSNFLNSRLFALMDISSKITLHENDCPKNPINSRSS